MLTESNDSNPLESLENLRKRLLDLSGRNRLLNFHHTKISALRVVDELPNQLIETLLSDHEMAFKAIPEPTREELIEAGYIVVDEETQLDQRVKKDPTAEEWARFLGYDTSYEVPIQDKHDLENKHNNTKIQTLFYPYELESQLRGLLSKAKTAIEETGSNILYLVLGFLEWHDRDKKHLAPLFLFPVQLKKGKMSSSSKTYEYRISYSGEDILPNLSLREKLAIDFNVSLPELDENTQPDEYIDAVRDVIAIEKPQWKVHRNITLTLLNFSKLLMYLDLNPSHWPDKQNILDHPIVRRFLSGYEKKDNGAEENYIPGFSEEYEIDDIKNVHANYPLIEDADSSQHSALIDVINGKNLVIEGPPGTGKSQTITNLIAALLAQGKRVLFVAEKLAALEVVKHRLDQAGLGEFCLELHSHKTQKRKMIDDISNRIERMGAHRSPVEIQADIARYEELKTKLKDYVECVNQKYKNTGRTIHEILMAATRYRKKIPVSPELLHPQNVSGENFDSSKQREIHDQVSIFAMGYAASALVAADPKRLDSHPWYGVTNTDIQIFDFKLIQQVLLDWQCALGELAAFKENVFQLFDEQRDVLSLDSVHDFDLLLADLRTIPSLTGEEFTQALPALTGEAIKKFKKYISLHGEIQQLYGKLSLSIAPELLDDLSFVSAVSEGVKTFESLLLTSNALSPDDIIHHLDMLIGELDEIKLAKDEIARHLPEDVRHLIGLHGTGVNELKDFIGIVASLKPTLWKFRDDIFDNEELDEILPLLHGSLNAAQDLESKLKDDFKLDQLPNKDKLVELGQIVSSGGFFKIFDSRWKRAKAELCGYAINSKIKVKDLLVALDDLIEFATQNESILNNTEYKSLLKEHFEGLGTNVEKIIEIREWYKLVRSNYGVGFGPKITLGNTILDLPVSLARSIRSLNESDYIERLDRVGEHIRVLTSVFRNFENTSNPYVDLIGTDGGLLAKIHGKLKDALDECKPLVSEGEFTLPKILQQIYDLQDLRKKVDIWTKADLDRILFNGKLGLRIGVAVDNIEGLSVAEHTVALAEALEFDLNNQSIKNLVYSRPVKETFDQLAELREQLSSLAGEQQKSYSAFEQKVALNYKNWIAFGGGRIAEVLEKNTRALEHEQALQTYLDYIRTRSYLDKIGYGSLADVVEQGGIKSDSIVEGCWAGTYDLLSREIFRKFPDLARFSGFNQDALIKQFKVYDEKLKTLQRAEIAAKIDKTPVPRGNSGGHVSQYTDLVLLEHECGKQKGHIPIRQLVKRAGDALLALKPCFMMGPMSTAQYLEPGKFLFDVVVMDEASQIKPEDALGTIARGKNLVVVGDPKQLPPTNFFNRLIREDDDPTGLEESESILDATLPIFESRRLRWHYRSQHESLIAFSNHSFYNNNLVLFPSPNHESDLFGIHFHRLKRGCFAGRRNNREAEAISDALKAHFTNHPDETVGIVAMSAEQRDQIERAIEQASKEDPLFRQLLEGDAQRSESLFLKNLENVQGDERDVILISMTYGPADVGGKVYQRFGPINSEVGWRRLNVLFTRSRKRMHIFSSMNSSDIIVSSSSSLGVKALRDFLAYCESGKLPQGRTETDRLPDSDFEISVMEAIDRHGFECVPQVGVAGFFIDIAVRDPGKPGSYLMGVECDGATYHSAKSVRDRDRLRQTVLERLGWNIRRIWSTDWFKNPDNQIMLIINELKELKTEPVEVIEPVLVNEPVEQVIEETTPTILKTVPNASIEPVYKLATEEIELKDKLIKYDIEVIQKGAGEIKENQRLLRPAMLEALLENMPTSKSEFLEVIPRYLREETAPGQGDYLTGVLDIISAEFEEV